MYSLNNAKIIQIVITMHVHSREVDDESFGTKICSSFSSKSLAQWQIIIIPKSLQPWYFLLLFIPELFLLYFSFNLIIIFYVCALSQLHTYKRKINHWNGISASHFRPSSPFPLFWRKVYFYTLIHMII